MYLLSEPGYNSVVMVNALRSSLPVSRVLWYIMIFIILQLKGFIPVSAPNVRNLLSPASPNLHSGKLLVPHHWTREERKE